MYREYFVCTFDVDAKSYLFIKKINSQLVNDNNEMIIDKYIFIICF